MVYTSRTTFEWKIRASIPRIRFLREHKDQESKMKFLKSRDTLSKRLWKAVIVEGIDPYDFYVAERIDIRDFNRYIKWMAERLKYHSGDSAVKPQPKKTVQASPVRKHPAYSMKKTLIGMDETYRKVIDCIEEGTKGIILSGHHGLGKTEFCYDIANHYDCKHVFRVQITETTNDTHLVGAVHLKNGFLKGIVYEAIDTAQKNPNDKYMLLFDEYTRGREDAMPIILPLLAERKLIVNDAYAQMTEEIMAPDNLLIIATGNVMDKGVRELGGAESDRWNGVHIEHITDTKVLKKIIKPKSEFVFNTLYKVYKLSIDYAKESRILAMSIRTFKNCHNLAQRKIDYGMSETDAVKEALSSDYMFASQANMNPSFRNTFNQILREVGLQ